MKILHIGNVSSVGFSLCQEFRRQGIEVDLISKNKSGLSYYKTYSWVYYVNNYWDEFCLKSISLKQYDIVHAHYLINLGSLAAALKVKNIPLVLHAHGDDTRPVTVLERCFQRYVASKSDILFYSTPDLLKNISWYKGNKYYSPNPFCIDREFLRKRTRNKKILIFGTLYREKKIERLFSFVKELTCEVDMLDAGPDVEREYYKRIIPKNVRLIPSVLRSNVPQMVANYSLVLGMSQDGSIRVSELEAMALGVPTLFPFVYNQLYAEDLPMMTLTQDNVSFLMNNDSLGEKQKQWVFKYHNVKNIVDQLVIFYKNVI